MMQQHATAQDRTWVRCDRCDFDGKDLMRVQVPPQELQERFRDDASVGAFNSYGFVKSSVPPLSEWKTVRSGCIWVKRSILEGLGVSLGDDTDKFASCVTNGGLANWMFQIAMIVASCERQGGIPCKFGNWNFNLHVGRHSCWKQEEWDKITAEGARNDPHYPRGIRECFANLDWFDAENAPPRFMEGRTTMPGLPHSERVSYNLGRRRIIGSYACYSNVDRVVKPGTQVAYWSLNFMHYHFQREAILRAFTFSRKVIDAATSDAAWQSIADKGTKRVSVHIRLGGAGDFRPVFKVPKEWFADTMQREFDCAATTFVVFTNRVKDAQPYLDLFEERGLSFVVPSTNQFETVALMTLCDGHILSPSLLGFWGAYLNPRQPHACKTVLHPHFATSYTRLTIPYPTWIMADDAGKRVPTLASPEELYVYLRSYSNVESYVENFRKHGGSCDELARVVESRGAFLAPPPKSLACCPSYLASVPRCRRRDVVAFTLFGNVLKYQKTLLENLRRMATFYPGWVPRVYVEDGHPDVDESAMRSACPTTQVVRRTAAGKMDGTMWRFQCFEDHEVRRFLSRDCDSLIGAREAAAVQEWVSGGKGFHIIRDAENHTSSIMAGTFGCDNDRLRAEGAKIQVDPSEFRDLGLDLARKTVDQEWLEARVYPKICNDCMVHDASNMPRLPDPDVLFVGAYAFEERKAKKHYIHVRELVKRLRDTGQRVTFSLDE